MGTTKTDTFGNYNPTEPRGDRCREHVEAALEEVGRERYFAERGTVPAVGEASALGPELVDGRLVVLDEASGESVGLLPVELNYLAICLANGFRYRGAVLASGTSPVPTVTVALDVTSG